MNKRQNSIDFERIVHERLTELGCVMLSPYVNSATPIKIICPQGHRTKNYPQTITGGYSICRICAGKTWDVFYFMENPITGDCKIGVTSGDIRTRLQVHRRAGLVKILRMYIDLPDYVAKTLEENILESLLVNNIQPISGREYFSSIAVNPISDFLDNWEKRYYRGGKGIRK